MTRKNNRKYNEIRDTLIERNYLMHPEGSVLISMGDTKVICSAFVEESVPSFLKGTGKGWITAEYSMLPGSTGTRKARDITKGKIDGRSQEIQRLIGRSLRSVADLKKIGERTVWIDCDVIQADGGTRTASINGAFVAMMDAFNVLKNKGCISEIPVKDNVAAISLGIVGGEILVDLDYSEDSSAEVDMNVVMTGKGEFIEIQGTGEKYPFSRKKMNELLETAEIGCGRIIEIQRKAISSEEK